MRAAGNDDFGLVLVAVKAGCGLAQKTQNIHLRFRSETNNQTTACLLGLNFSSTPSTAANKVGAGLHVRIQLHTSNPAIIIRSKGAAAGKFEHPIKLGMND